MANPRKPAKLKLVHGTDRPDRAHPELELPPVDETPDAPDWMINTFAVDEWNRLTQILMAHKLLTDADLSTLGHLCNLHGKMVQLYNAGETPTASMLSTLRNMQTDFGLSPVARGKVSPAGNPAGGGANPFAGNGKPAPKKKPAARKSTAKKKSPARKKAPAKKKARAKTKAGDSSDQ
jgi:phage terminase small subunit